MVVFWQSGCIPAKVVVLGQNLFYSDKVFFIRPKVVVVGQSVCLRAKVVVIGQKWLY